MLAMVSILWLAAVIWIIYTILFDTDMRIPIEQEADRDE